MILNHLENYYQSLDREFHIRLAGLLRQASGKNLHTLRVNVKKHLAFFNLLQFLDQKFSLKSVRKPFRNCMKQTGRLRDLEVELGIVKQHENELRLGPGYSNHILEEQRYHLALLTQFEEKFSILRVREAGETVEDRLHRLAGRIDIWIGLNNYFLNQLDLVRQSVEVAVLTKKDKPLHELRMYVKELMLNLKLIQNLAPQKVRLKKLYDHLDKLQDLLGDWHDRVNALARMQRGKKLASKKVLLALKQDKKVYSERILFYLKSYTLLHLWALNIFHDLFAHPPVEKIPPPKIIKLPKSKTPRTSSFPQLNIGEGRK